jgi:uncharacterized protein (DUF488 family)
MAGKKPTSSESDGRVIFTIGHSTRSVEEFIDLLKKHEVQLLIDVRRFPASRRYPHFNGPALAESLSTAGIHYRHLPALGGRRPSKPDSVNLGWRNAGFRGYADYMQTKEFPEALEELMHLAKRPSPISPAHPGRDFTRPPRACQDRPFPRGTRPHPAVIMCAEAVPWRCHRNLISDALVVKGWQVSHITSASKVDHHRLTSFARVSERGLVYPAEIGQSSLF